MNSQIKQTGSAISKLTFTLSIMLASSLASAGTLSIADNALELATGVEPNIMILADDSGSMDWGMMTDQNSGIYFLGNFAYYYTHPDPGSSGPTPADNSFTFVLPTEEHLDDEGLAAPQGGVWRVWNKDYNRIYYDPAITYEPWEGQDINNNPYTNADPTNALYDPYKPAGGSLDLTATITYDTDCGLAACGAIGNLSGNFTVTDFYPARYYTWTDTDSDGVVDDTDAHTLVEIPAGTAQMQNFANWFSYYRKRDLTAKNAYSKVIEPSTAARVGFAAINNSAGNRIPVASMNISIFSGNKLSLMNNIFNTQPSGFTPLRQNLESVGLYFECETGNIFGETTGLTPGGANCPVQSSAEGGQCQQNYTVLTTDGFWNGGDPSVDNADGTPLGPAAPTVNGTFDGASFADGESDTLADVAMDFYERDLHGTLTNIVPTTSRDRTRYTGNTDPFNLIHQHMTTYTVGFGVNGLLSANPTDVNAAFAWGDAYNSDAEKIDDLRHAAWNGRGDFLSASDPNALTDSLVSIFAEIAAGTGTATAVAFNSQNLSNGALVFRAFFDASTNAGDLIAQSIDINGVISSNIEWSAATQIDSDTTPNSDTREIITYDPIANAGIPFQWASLNATQQAQLNLPVAGATPPDPLGEDRVNYLRGQTENEGADFANGEFRERPTTQGLLGDIVHSTPLFIGDPGFTNRDFVPFPIGTGDLYSQFASANAGRTSLVYIGANDGMLHGINALTGEEIFAYVPNTLMGDLSLLTTPDYTHRYYVDQSPAVNDVFINDNWATVLVGGPGYGASDGVGTGTASNAGYFALDITDPTSLATEASAINNVMWEFTQADDVGTPPDGNDLNLGLSITRPIITMTNAVSGGEQRWAAIFGNGYNSASADGDAELYIVYLDGGQDGTWTQGTDFIKISTDNGKAESADTTTPNSLGGVRAVDVDQNGTVDIVYAGDLQGNVYRFNLNANVLASPNNTSNNPVQTLFTALYNNTAGLIQPITTTPVAIDHPTEAGYIILVGTGSYFTAADNTDLSIQSIYGLWDELFDASDAIVPVDYARLQEQVYTNEPGTIGGFSVRTLTNDTFTWGTSGQRKQGWNIDLDVAPAGGGGVEFPGERAIRDIVIFGSNAFVNSVLPSDSAVCSSGPGGFSLAFNPIFGGSGEDPIFDLNDDGDFDSSDNVGGSEDANKIVTGRRFDDGTPTSSSRIGNRIITQLSGTDTETSDITSGSDIDSVAVNDAGIGSRERQSWREIEL